MMNLPLRPQHRRDPSERRRFTVLLLSGAVLTLLPLLSTTTPKIHFLLAALLFPAALTALALLRFDTIRSTYPDDPKYFFLALSCVVFLLNAHASPSRSTWILLSCVYVTWGWLFETALAPVGSPLILSLDCSFFSAYIGVNGRMSPPHLIVWTAMTMTEEELPLFFATIIAPCSLFLIFDAITNEYGERMFPPPTDP